MELKELIKQWPLAAVPLILISLISYFGFIGLIVHGFFLFFRNKPVPSDYYAPAFAGLTIVLNIIGIFVIHSARGEWLTYRRMSDGTILAAETAQFTATRESTDENNNRQTTTDYVFVRKVKYTFAVENGAEAGATTVLTGQAILDTNYGTISKSEKDLGTDYAEGKHVPVYYDVRDPSRNMLTEFPKNANRRTIIGFGVIIAIYACYLPSFFAFLNWVKNKTPAP
jgi:hypothetical protein